MSATERSGWRDARLSQRHREWGFNVPGADLDFLLIEYDLAKVMALVDYKHERHYQWPVDKDHATYRAMVDFADRPCDCGSVSRRIPAFACRYGHDLSWFEPDPLNELATVWLPSMRRLSERDWVAFLYRLRARSLPPQIAERLAA